MPVGGLFSVNTSRLWQPMDEPNKVPFFCVGIDRGTVGSEIYADFVRKVPDTRRAFIIDQYTA